LVSHNKILFAEQDCRRAIGYPKNPKCTKTLGGRDFTPDATGGAYRYHIASPLPGGWWLTTPSQGGTTSSRRLTSYRHLARTSLFSNYDPSICSC